LEVERWGERSFELTEEQWREQHRQNQQEMSFFMTQLGDAWGNGSLDEEERPKINTLLDLANEVHTFSATVGEQKRTVGGTRVEHGFEKAVFAVPGEGEDEVEVV
jgi:hypothetical protein